MLTIQGKAVSAGYALGQVYILKTETLECPRTVISADQIPAQKEILHQALIRTQQNVKDLIAHSVDSGAQDSYAIFEGYLEIVTDDSLESDIANYIEDECVDFNTALCVVSKQYVDDMLSLDDPYLQARGEDFKQIFRMIKTASNNDNSCSIAAGNCKPFVLVASEIGPADMESIDSSLLRGILVEKGSKTSHAAILSRGLGIPMVSGMRNIYDQIQTQALVAVDGTSGTVVVNPSENVIKEYTKKIEEIKKENADNRFYLDKSAVTKDGTHITIYANIGSEEDVSAVLENNADGIGLFRTEFLFMKNGGVVLPSEEEQYRAYSQVLEAMKDKPVIFRTLDAGGDKNIDALQIPKEENPFLGLRAIRYCLRNIDVFKTQLRALLRAAVHGNAKIMLPMIISIEEIQQAKARIADIIAECKAQNIPVAENVPIGIMIETPAAAVTAADLAKEAAFFSIGTNDLTQYTLAVDRGNEVIADLYNETHPAVLALIRYVISCANNAGIPVDVCGEMAGNITCTKALYECGLREFSMSPIQIVKIKKTLAGI